MIPSTLKRRRQNSEQVVDQDPTQPLALFRLALIVHCARHAGARITSPCTDLIATGLFVSEEVRDGVTL